MSNRYSLVFYSNKPIIFYDALIQTQKGNLQLKFYIDLNFMYYKLGLYYKYTT